MSIFARIGLIIIVITVSYGCSTGGWFRGPASIPLYADNTVDFVSFMADLGKKITEVKDQYECRSVFGKTYQQLLVLESSDVNFDKTRLSASQIIEASFNNRLALRKRVELLSGLKQLTPECLSSIRSLTRSLRYIEDYLVELTSYGENVEYVNLKGEKPYFLVNPSFESKFSGVNDLKSGDVILSRGNAYSSAAIARIGRDSAQFSHISFVYRDKKGRLYTTEAHIEIGNIAAPIKAHIDEKNSRTVVFRFRDQAFAHRASEAIFKKVLKKQKKGRRIEYDFAMDYRNPDRIFCSEVVYHGFQLASDGKMDVPLFKTKFEEGLIPFLQMLGVKIDYNNVKSFDTFAPGDLEFDPRFELVAEWRNPAKMKDSRIKDMLLDKTFEWMSKRQYKLNVTGSDSFKTGLFWLIRRTPILGIIAKDKFPLNMTHTQLGMFISIEKLGDAMHAKIKKEQEGRENPLTPYEMYEVLEKLRKDDLERFRKGKKTVFHLWLNPDGKSQSQR